MLVEGFGFKIIQYNKIKQKKIISIDKRNKI